MGKRLDDPPGLGSRAPDCRAASLQIPKTKHSAFGGNCAAAFFGFKCMLGAATRELPPAIEPPARPFAMHPSAPEECRARITTGDDQRPHLVAMGSDPQLVLEYYTEVGQQEGVVTLYARWSTRFRLVEDYPNAPLRDFVGTGAALSEKVLLGEEARGEARTRPPGPPRRPSSGRAASSRSGKPR